ncbi:MAG: carboxypeptidase regulatory-like domain-containing protein [Actinobacteria bacterium]|nr:carboxypeptidase regulatory-like domain-containing protein [Actinomycetota bacterium]
MNKRNIIRPFLCMLISVLLLFSLALPGCASSKDKSKIAKIDIFVNGEKLETGVKPRLVNNVVLLPAEDVLAAMGAEVFYDEESQLLEAFKENMHITMYADADYASVNNMIRMLEAPLKLVEGQLMAPCSFMSEAMDCKVTVDEVSGDIQIYTAPSLYDELGKSEIDFSISASDIRFLGSSGFDLDFTKPGNSMEIKFRIYKNQGSPGGGGKAKLIFDGFHIDTIPFFIDEHNSYTQVDTYYVIPLNRYASLAPDEIKNAVFSVEIIPDYLASDTNLSNNKAEISLDIKAVERKTNSVVSNYLLDSIFARFNVHLASNMTNPGDFLRLLSYIRGTGQKTIINYIVNGEIIEETFMSSYSLEKSTSHSCSYFVPHDYIGLINYEVLLDNGQYRFIPVPVAPFEYSVIPKSIRWEPRTGTKNYSPGKNLALSAVIMRDNKNDFTGPLRVYFLVNGELSPPIKVDPPSGTTPYLGDASYYYMVPQDAPPVIDVEVLVDPGQLFYEHNRSNNTYSVSIPETIEGSSGNDISISEQDLIIAPSYILPGDRIQLIATIKNNSKERPDKEVRIIFKINGEIISGGDFTRPKSYFWPGQGYTVSKMWEVPDDFRGDIFFTVEIDPEGKLTGDNRSDNNASIQTTTVKPDLSIEEKSLMPAGRLISGSPGTLKARINNFGAVEAENVHVAFYIDGEEVGSNIIDILPAYSSFDVFTGITVPAFTSQADNHSIEGKTGYENPATEKKQISYSAVIDPSNLVEESNEENNSAGPAELDVSVPSTKGTVHIKVTDLNYDVIENAEVVLSAQNESASAKTDSAGYCTFFHVPFGPFEATASKTGYRINTTFDEYMHTGSISHYTQIHLDDRSSLTGHISTASGAKLDGVKISADNSNEQVYTNSEGWYELRLAAGTYTIMYSKAGYRPETLTLTVGAGQDIVQDITMQTTHKIDTHYVTFSDEGRKMTSSSSIFVPVEYDIDRDGLNQAWEDLAMNEANPYIELDEEENWLDNQDTDKVVNFVRITPYPNNSDTPEYILFFYCITWSKDYGRYAEYETLFEAHNGDVETVILAWKVIDDKNLELKWVYTSAHGTAKKADTSHSGVWKAVGESCNVGKVKLWPDQKMCATLEFVNNRLKLQASEDKHAIYPTEECGEDVMLVYIPWPLAGWFVMEDCGGGGMFRFDCYNVGEPEPEIARLMDDIDDIFPNESIWSGNKNNPNKFCGGKKCGDKGPGTIGHNLTEIPTILEEKLDEDL